MKGQMNENATDEDLPLSWSNEGPQVQLPRLKVPHVSGTPPVISLRGNEVAGQRVKPTHGKRIGEASHPGPMAIQVSCTRSQTQARVLTHTRGRARLFTPTQLQRQRPITPFSHGKACSKSTEAKSTEAKATTAAGSACTSGTIGVGPAKMKIKAVKGRGMHLDHALAPDYNLDCFVFQTTLNS